MHTDQLLLLYFIKSAKQSSQNKHPKSHFTDNLTLFKTIEMVLFKENMINFWQVLCMT